MKFPENLKEALMKRKASGLFRSLGLSKNAIDFCSNDYLGFAKKEALHKIKYAGHNLNGSTGSRLISGNHESAIETEEFVANYFDVESALIFNSGYDANLGLISSITSKKDLVLYDELCHASIIDGLKLSHATHYKFNHNSTLHLNELLQQHQEKFQNVYVVTESVFSMDGDEAPLLEINKTCLQKQCFLIVDEAHAVGVFGKRGAGLCDELGIAQDCFARVITFGKALGCHGAAVLGSSDLRNYLINFARSFIYTTALPPESFLKIKSALQLLEKSDDIALLRRNIDYFKSNLTENLRFIPSRSAIQCIIISGNENTQQLAEKLIEQGFEVKSIKSPTVKAGSERLRICIHSYNSQKEIEQLINALKILINSI